MTTKIENIENLADHFELEKLKLENAQLNDDLYFLAHLLLIKFRPTNFCLTSKEQQKIKAIYKKTFTEKNNLEQ